jgi:ribonuclease J
VSRNKLRIIPLGGLGEIGRNMMVIEYDEEIIVIDAGLMFPENDMLGVDIIIPDMSYLVERADRVRAIIITHGHEDHVGALPYLLNHVRAPIYGTRLTLGLVEVKLREARIKDAELHAIAPGDTLALDPFCIEFFHVSHSIPDGIGMGIETPAGLIVHSGDFKFDHAPADGQRADFAKLAELGGRGVLLLLSDSTNAETPGYTPSEQSISEVLSRVFASAKGRIIVATFASNISRIQQIADIAQRHGRKVALVGRSMVGNARIARELGYLNVPDDLLITVDQINQLPNDQVTLICTGSQGEPTSVLVRMGQHNPRSVSVVPGDTVIVSATPIPGNEEFVHRTLDNLFRLGADVYYDEVLDVHVSGHASQEEQKLLINLIRPKYFVPIHGEYRHLVLHSKLAQQCGVAPENVIIIESGDVLEIDEFGAEVVDQVSANRIFVDGHGVGDIEMSVIEDRRMLAHSGFLVAVVALDKYTGSVMGEPQISSRGFISETESVDLLAKLRQEASRVAGLGGSRSEIVDRLKGALSRLAFEETGRRPIIVPVVTKL